MLQLEKLIKNKLNNFEYKDIQSDWSAFEKKLPKKKPSIYKYIAIGAVAAVLITSLAIVLNNKNVEPKNSKTQITEQNHKTNNTNTTKEIISTNTTNKELNKKEESSNNIISDDNNNTTTTNNSNVSDDNNKIEQPEENIIIKEESYHNNEVAENIETDDYSPISTFEISNKKGCSPLDANFTANENHKNISYRWEFSDGYTSTKKSIKHVFKKAGKYTVKLITEYKNNKKTSISEQEINVYESPKSSFTYTVDDNSYYFDGPDNTDLLWNFGDNTKSTEIDPEHIFKLIGKTEVKLTTKNEFGCKTEYKETINIEPIFQIANAFSPDNNGFNDAFGPIFEYPENYDFELYIYNAKGQLYFKSTSANQSWNGKINNTDQKAEKGYYLWKLLIKDKYGNKIIKNGNLNITN